jgi:hypothetical protein
MTTERCIFRYIYNDGARCTGDQLSEDCKYCRKHKNKTNYIFEVMDAALNKGNNVNDERDLYEIFTFIYDNDLQQDEDNKKKLFFAIVAYLLSRATLLSILYKTLYLNGKNIEAMYMLQKKTKQNVITFVYDILMNTYQISKSDHAVYNIIKIQRFVRRHMYRKIIEYNKGPAKNTEDPFTYDDISEIPDDNKFSYLDRNGYIYIFNTVEFEYYLRTSDTKTNPYTKDNLPEYVMNRLHLLMLYNKLQAKQENEFKWQTILHAYTDLSHIMEKAGFYTSVEWFEKISFGICKNIIACYKRTSSNSLYFCEELNRETYVFDFCKEAINLFKDADDHYLLCCNFMKALAANITEFRQNMPSWLEDDAYVPHSAVLLMYVQDLLETMDDLEIYNQRHITFTNGSISRVAFERY